MGGVRPLRVLYVVTELDPGGAERQLAALAAGLDRRRYDPAVLSLAPPGTLAAPLRQAGVPVFSVGLKRATQLTGLTRLRDMLREAEPDLLHTFLFHANVAGRVCARWAGLDCPVVASVRTEDPRRLHRWGESVTSRWASLFVGNSASLGAFVHREMGVPWEKIAVVPNAVLPMPPRQPGSFRAALGIAPEVRLVTAVGRLDRQKGFDVLLDALARLPAGSRPVLALVGEGPEAAALQARAQRLGVDARFPGRLPSPVDAFGDADLVAAPSRWEGMPNAVLEAMSLGKAVVGSRVGGIADLLEGAGALVPPEDPAALGAALKALLDDPRAAAALGAQAAARAAGHSVPRMVAEYTALYRRLLQEPEAAAA